MKLEVAAIVLALLARMVENQIAGHWTTGREDLLFGALAVLLWFTSLAYMVTGLVA